MEESAGKEALPMAETPNYRPKTSSNPSDCDAGLDIPQSHNDPATTGVIRDDGVIMQRGADNEVIRRSRGKQGEQGTPGILRVDSTSRSSRHAVVTTFLSPQADPPSPQPSIDRLSVTFALAEDRSVNISEEATSGSHHRPHMSFVTVPLAAGNSTEMRRVPTITDGEDGGDEDDYSASACAIIQRRTSLRRQSRRKRRNSSPFSPDAESVVRRRSSAFTTSSGDTAISVEEGGTQEQIFENLKLHKEVLGGVKQQPWPLRRKIKLVQQAKSYVRRHEGALQERLAQSRSTKDVIARASILINKKWQYFRRELVNLQIWLIPWELRIKEIESHFGSAVASYFIFLRWLFWINLVMAATLTAFVAIPEVLTADVKLAGERKIMLPEERNKSKHLLTLWEFEGVLKYSPFFYGWYTNKDSNSGYRLPLAYFIANLVVYVYSFVAILRKMAENSRMSKLSEKEDECAFSWKLFTGWDFMIGNHETAHNRIASIVLGFKEALLEEAEKEKDERNWKITTVRIFVNISVIFLLALSAFAVVEVVARSTEPEADDTWWRQNEITVVMSLISYIFPIFFEILGIFENYHPRKQLRLQLARIMVLNLLNLYSLIFALFDKISHMEGDLQSLRPNKTASENCRSIPMPCSTSLTNVTLASLSLVLLSNNNPTNFSPSFSTTNAQDLHKISESSISSYSTSQLFDGSTSDLYTSSTSELYNPSTSELYSASTSELYSANTSLNTVNDFNSTLEFYDYNYVEYENLTDFENTTSFYLQDNSTTTVTENATDRMFSTDFFNESMETKDFNDTSMSIMRTTSTREISISVTSESIMTTLSSAPSSSEITSEETSHSMTSSVSENTTPQVEENVIMCCQQICEIHPDTESSEEEEKAMVILDLETRRKLRRLCWETMFGQELAKLTVMDLVLTVISTLGMDFFRAVFVRFMNNCWCWDLEKQFPQYGDFKIAENILHLVNNQGMVWMGMFFSPGLATLNLLKLGILMYLRSWAVLTCNVPHEVVFRASRSNNFYLALLLTMLFLCVLPVGYAIVWVEPSWHCGPFSDHHRIYYLATKSLKNALPSPFHKCLDYIASPGTVIPLIVLMALIIYYMVSLTSSLREANIDLKIQLRQERTEERRKMFQIAEKKQEVHDAPSVRWKKILPVLPSSKTAGMAIAKGFVGRVAMERKERKRSAASEAGEATDMEQDSLPHDPTLNAQDITIEAEPKKRQLIKQTSNNRSFSSGSMKEGDSLGSQWSDYGIIPKIRISGTEGVMEGCHSSPGRASITSVAPESPQRGLTGYK